MSVLKNVPNKNERKSNLSTDINGKDSIQDVDVDTDAAMINSERKFLVRVLKRLSFPSSMKLKNRVNNKMEVALKMMMEKKNMKMTNLVATTVQISFLQYL